MYLLVPVFVQPFGEMHRSSRRFAKAANLLTMTLERGRIQQRWFSLGICYGWELVVSW